MYDDKSAGRLFASRVSLDRKYRISRVARINLFEYVPFAARRSTGGIFQRGWIPGTCISRGFCPCRERIRVESGALEPFLSLIDVRFRGKPICSLRAAPPLIGKSLENNYVPDCRSDSSTNRSSFHPVL